MASIKPQGSFIGNVNKTEQKQLKKFKIILIIVAVVLIIAIGIAAISYIGRGAKTGNANLADYDIPAYDSQTYEVLNNNVPFFNPDDYGVTVFEEYSELDAYGRCGVAFANICHELCLQRPEVKLVRLSRLGGIRRSIQEW